MATGDEGPRIRELKAGEDIDDIEDDDDDIEDETILERIQVSLNKPNLRCVHLPSSVVTSRHHHPHPSSSPLTLLERLSLLFDHLKGL